MAAEPRDEPLTDFGGRALEQARTVRAKGYAAGLEAAAEIAEAIDSGRGNEKEIAKAIRDLGKEKSNHR